MFANLSIVVFGTLRVKMLIRLHTKVNDYPDMTLAVYHVRKSNKTFLSICSLTAQYFAPDQHRQS